MTGTRPSGVLRGVGVHADRVHLQGKRTGPAAMLHDVQVNACTAIPERADPVPPSPADEMLQAARQQAQRQGYEEGLREGLAAARERMEADLTEQRRRHERATQEAVQTLQREQTQAAEAAARRLDAVCLSLSRQVDSLLNDLEQQAVGLAFQAIQKILGAPPHRIGAVQALLEQQMVALKDAGALRVFLNPTDLALFGRADAAASLNEAVQLVADARLPAGGCVIHSGTGRLDVGLPGQLAKLGQLWREITEAAEARTQVVASSGGGPAGSEGTP